MTKNKSGWTPLHLSAQNGHLEVTKFFLETYDDKNPKSKSGITPLHNAAREGHFQICKLILECGLKEKNPREVDGKTPLHWAAENGHLETFKVGELPILIYTLDYQNILTIGFL